MRETDRKGEGLEDSNAHVNVCACVRVPNCKSDSVTPLVVGSFRKTKHTRATYKLWNFNQKCSTVKVKKSSKLSVLIVSALHAWYYLLFVALPARAQIPDWHHWEQIWSSAWKPEGWESLDKETGARGHARWSLRLNIFIQICSEPLLRIVFWAVVVTQYCSLTILALLRNCGGHQSSNIELGPLPPWGRKTEREGHHWSLGTTFLGF